MVRTQTIDTFNAGTVYSPDTRERLRTAVQVIRNAGARCLSPERYAEARYVRGRLTACMDDARAFRQGIVGQGWTTAEHVQTARAWLEVEKDARDTWDVVVTAARKAHGDHGSLISGVYRDHFPAEVKDVLRTLCRVGNFASDASLAHWTAGAGKRLETWRRERDRINGRTHKGD